MTNGITIEGETSEDTVGRENEAHEIFEGTLESNWKGTEIIHVQGEGYKIIIDMGSYTYALDLPDDYTLEDISNFESDSTDETRKIAEAGVESFTLEEFNSGFLRDDTLINVPASILSLEGDMYEIAQNWLVAVENNRSRITSRLLSDDEYMALLNAEYIATDGDMKKAVENFALTDTYGNILNRLGVSQAQVDAERKEYIDKIGFSRDINDWKTLFTRTALTEYGGDLPVEVIDYLAENTARGRFTQSQAIDQVNALFDSYSGIKLDTGVLGALSGQTITQTTGMEAEVDELLDKYIPKHLHGSYDKPEEAGKVRNIANYRATFINKLKKTRAEFYPMYDMDTSWASIVASKKENAYATMGVHLKDSDPLLDQIIKLNDYSKESKLMRKAGLERNYGKVKADLNNAMVNTFGSGIVTSEGFVG